MNDIALPRIDRPTFFTGERLLAPTLEDSFDGLRAMHWLHNRALHGWGVAFGLAVTGARGAVEVSVAAGYAVDAAGRDLVLPDTTRLDVPPVSSAADGSAIAFTLTMSYTDDADARAETRGGVCGTEGAVRLGDAPTLRFQPPATVREGLDLVLAQVRVRDCRLVEARRLDGRRTALSAGRPYVAGGETSAGGTDWRPWPDAATPVGVVASVPTAEAGFSDTPRYQARVDGPRLVNASSSPTGQAFVVDGPVSVDVATAHAFDAVVLLPKGLTGSSGAPTPLNPDVVFDPGVLDAIGWRVVWIGVEDGES